jgi:hypothetical protein
LQERWIFPDGSRVWNAFGGITTILEDGDLLIGGAFSIKRLIDVIKFEKDARPHLVAAGLAQLV